jgi:hypothetical protein
MLTFHKLLPEQFSLHYFNKKYQDISSVIYPKPKYKSFSITKKNGKQRRIDAPCQKVKELQKIVYSSILINQITPRPSSHGFIKGKSILTNATPHAKKKFVFNIDLKDFFSSISFYQVRALFKGKPFLFSHNVATCIAQICCYNGALPQGGICSPIISNLICRNLDRDLQQLAKKNRATYTRYADDITFSFSVNSHEKLPTEIVETNPETTIPGIELTEIIKRHGFQINPDKTRLQSNRQRQTVTGLTVNEYPNVSRNYIDKIRGALKSIETYGLISANARFQSQPTSPSLIKHLHGKLLFLAMIKGPSDPTYKNIAHRFNEVSRTNGLELRAPISNEVDRLSLVKNATYVIRCHGDHTIKDGSAFYVKDLGIITCDHNLWLEDDPKKGHFPIDQIEILDKDDEPIALIKKVIKFNSFYDYAILEPDFVSTNNAHLAVNQTTIHQGSQVFLAGYPAHNKGQTMSLIPSIITSTYRKCNECEYIEIAQQIRQGNSGGPVLNSNAEVIGIAVEGADQSRGKNGVLTIREIVTDRGLTEKDYNTHDLTTKDSPKTSDTPTDETKRKKPLFFSKISINSKYLNISHSCCIHWKT